MKIELVSISDVMMGRKKIDWKKCVLWKVWCILRVIMVDSMRVIGMVSMV